MKASLFSLSDIESGWWGRLQIFYLMVKAVVRWRRGTTSTM